MRYVALFMLYINTSLGGVSPIFPGYLQFSAKSLSMYLVSIHYCLAKAKSNFSYFKSDKSGTCSKECRDGYINTFEEDKFYGMRSYIVNDL